MRSVFTKMFLLVLALAIALSLFSCEDEEKKTEEKPAVTTTSENKETDDNDSYEYAKSLIPDVNYDGYEFRVLTLEQSFDYQSYTARNVIADEILSIPINDAVYERNKYLEEKLGCKFVDIPIDTLGDEFGQWHMLEVIETSIYSGLDEYDITFAPMSQLATLSCDGCFVDLATIDELNLDGPWWDQRAREDLILNGKLYFCACDGDVIDKQTTWGTMFNKELIRDNNLEDPYELVKSGKWTADKYIEMAKAARKDLDGNGVYNDKDCWGSITEYNSTYGFYAGFGGYIVEKDDDGGLKFAMSTPNAIEAVSKAIALMQDDEATMKVENIDQGEETKWLYASNLFAGGQALFRTTDINTVERWRTMKSDFGIIPMPKLNEDQENYSCGVATGTGTGVAIMQTVKDLSRTATILEAFVSTSRYTLLKGYYDATLNGVVARDEESSEMLDIIFSSRHFDLGYIYNWGGFGDMLSTVAKSGSNTFASSYDAKLTSAGKAMNRSLKALQELEY